MLQACNKGKGRCFMLSSRLLIFNKENEELAGMADYFQESGYTVYCCKEYDEIFGFLNKGMHKLDVLLFVTKKPDHRGYDLIEKIRDFSDIGLIMISNDSKLDSQLYAYSKKIDDYIVNPVPLPLVEAHVEALIRRIGEKEMTTERVGELSVDYDARKITLAGKPLKVTAKEFDLIEYFIRHRGMVLSRDKILDAVWGFDYIGGYRSVDTLVKKLRAKFTKEYPYIKTVYGVGYSFDVQERS